MRDIGKRTVPRVKLGNQPFDGELALIHEAFQNARCNIALYNPYSDGVRVPVTELEKVGLIANLLKNHQWIFDKKLRKKAEIFLHKLTAWEKAKKAEERRKWEERRRFEQKPVNRLKALLRANLPERTKRFLESLDLKTLKQLEKEYVELAEKRGLGLSTDRMLIGISLLKQVIMEKQINKPSLLKKLLSRSPKSKETTDDDGND